MILPLMKQLNSKRLILASSSPRRKSILENIGLKFEVIPSNYNEENLSPSEFANPWDFAIETAYEKGLEVAERVKDEAEIPELIISSDTIVVQDGKVYGKPCDESEAREMLSQFSANTHRVYTGVVCIWRGFIQEKSQLFVDKFYEQTNVKMATLSPEIISAYIQTGEPLDKAGSYGIQGLGATFVERIEGDFLNVAGFPLHKFCERVRRHYNEEH